MMVSTCKLQSEISSPAPLPTCYIITTRTQQSSGTFAFCPMQNRHGLTKVITVKLQSLKESLKTVAWDGIAGHLVKRVRGDGLPAFILRAGRWRGGREGSPQASLQRSNKNTGNMVQTKFFRALELSWRFARDVYLTLYLKIKSYT